MASDGAVLTGQCHCGGVQVEFRSTRPVSALQVRACQCSFCRRHGAATISDPAGEATIESFRPLIRYRFGLQTCDMLICAACGVYVAAARETDEGWRATINVAGLAMTPLNAVEAEPVDYGSEDAAARIARRANGWTPAVIVEG
jgi:hypothetical protein